MQWCDVTRFEARMQPDITYISNIILVSFYKMNCQEDKVRAGDPVRILL
jgi:hypothetical protein